jgi:hypothetical protein
MRVLLALAATLALLVGCGGTRLPDPAAAKPAAFQLEGFGDLPLWLLSGYQIDPEAGPPLAVAVAGGAVRRLSVGYITRDEVDGESTLQVLDRFAGALPDQGWSAGARTGGPDARVQRWMRNDEALVVGAGKDGRRTTVFLLLGPDTGPAPR